MAEHTTIEWTDATWNPVTGCTLVDEGCRHCYAATLAATRLKNHPSRAGLARINAGGEAKFTGEVRWNEQWLDQPLRWTRPRKIFVCAHADLFHPAVPDAWIDRVFAVMAMAPHHTFQVLTKRPERARAYLTDPFVLARVAGAASTIPWQGNRVLVFDGTTPLPNVWLGTSVSDQASADLRIPDLLATRAAVRFLSVEPMLGPVDLTRIRIAPEHHTIIDGLRGYALSAGGRTRLNLVIVGGESGRGARPMHPDWARALRDQCQAAGVAFHFKQWGQWLHEDQQEADGFDWADAAERNLIHAWPDQSDSIRLRKSAAGRLLDGREWNEVPG
jgi:protein gp37